MKEQICYCQKCTESTIRIVVKTQLKKEHGKNSTDEAERRSSTKNAIIL